MRRERDSMRERIKRRCWHGQGEIQDEGREGEAVSEVDRCKKAEIRDALKLVT